MVVSVLIFILMFCLIVISHEFGHYIIGKRNGIHATEFFIGMGPKLITWTKDGTEFSIRPIPIGGACVFAGMDGLEEEAGVTPDNAFHKAPVWARFATLLAGPMFNILLAYVIAVIFAFLVVIATPTVVSVSEGSGAYEAGLREGDVITKINHHYVHFYEEVLFTSYFMDGSPLKITYERDGEKYTTLLTPTYNEEEGRYLMGITGGEYIECSALESLKYGAYEVDYALWSTLQSLRLLFQGRIGKDALSGPVGMVKMVDDTYDFAKKFGFMEVLVQMLNLTMLLSANLAVMNLLPIPALDGGRLLFVLIEAIRGKPVPPEKEGYVHLAGMALLLVLVVFVFVNDITKFFR